ncbi:MAG: hypothetical protein ACOY16_01595 [Chloroflexota bacterium]
MSHRTTGVTLIAIAALLFCARYLAAAIFGSGMPSWSAENYRALLQYVGAGLVYWSVVALIVEIIELARAEKRDTHTIVQGGNRSRSHDFPRLESFPTLLV